MMMTSQLTVPKPSYQDFELRNLLLCGPGPCNLYPSVEKALTKPIFGHSCDGQYKLFDDIRAGLRYVFQTSSQAVMSISGAGHSGMEAVISNLVAPGDKLLVACRGIWDERAIEMAQRYGIKPVIIRRAPTETFTFDEIEIALRHHRPAALFVTHGCSSTGTVQDITNLGKICHRYGALLIVDTVVSLGGVPFLMDAWGVDAVYTSLQKALGGPTGIAPVALSERAWKVIETREHLPPFYLDVKLISEQWNCFGNFRKYHHTMSPPLLHALRACLMEITKEGLENSWKRQKMVTQRFHAHLNNMPVKFFVPKPADRLDTVTPIVLPEGTDYLAAASYLREKHGIVVMGGLGPTAGKVLRVGIMGVNASNEVADLVANALKDTIQHLKFSKL